MTQPTVNRFAEGDTPKQLTLMTVSDQWKQRVNMLRVRPTRDFSNEPVYKLSQDKFEEAVVVVDGQVEGWHRVKEVRLHTETWKPQGEAWLTTTQTFEGGTPIPTLVKKTESRNSKNSEVPEMTQSNVNGLAEGDASKQ